MKIRARNSNHGGVLVTTLVVCMLVGIMLTAYLAMVSQQQTFTMRSQVWNHCIPMCEAGIEEAMAHLNHVRTSNDFAINGWEFKSGLLHKERDLNNGNYIVSIDTNTMPPVIIAAGGLRGPLSAMYVTRKVRVQTRFNQQFPNAILARGDVVMNGNGRVDSFNSTNEMESTGGQYDPNEATDRASVATTDGDLNLGNVSVYGTVATGPDGDVELRANGNVGSEEYNNDATNNGDVESGHSADDVNIYIPPGTLPEGWGEAAPPDGGTVGTIKYEFILRNGDYQVGGNFNLGNNQKMIVLGKARLYVAGATSVGGQASIQIDAGGSVEWYAGGKVDMNGTITMNTPGYAKNFSLIGLDSCTSVYLGGNAPFIGTVYAPNAAVTVKGTPDFFGAIVGKTITIMGDVNFHYDEALRTDPKRGRFFVASWQEL